MSSFTSPNSSFFSRGNWAPVPQVWPHFPNNREQPRTSGLHSEKCQSWESNPSGSGLRICAFEDCIIASVLSQQGSQICFRNSFCFPHHPSFRLRIKVWFFLKEENYSPFLISSPQMKGTEAKGSFWNTALKDRTDHSKGCSWGCAAVDSPHSWHQNCF